MFNLSTKKNKYDFLVVFLLYWTALQDILLGIFLNVTGSISMTNILFYLKDILMVTLFIYTIFKNKFPLKLVLPIFVFFLLIILYSSISIINGISMFKVLASIRGWLLLPFFLIIGFGIKNKKKFAKKIVKFICSFLLFAAVFGIIDYIIDSFFFSTIPFWTKLIGLGNFHSIIKQQGDGLINGLPGNFYGQYGGDFFSQKRLVGIWGGPLTAAYVLTIPCITFLLFSFVEMNKRKRIEYFVKFIIVYIAIILTYTRAIIIPLTIIIIGICLFKSQRIRVLSLLLIPTLFIIIASKWNIVTKFLYDGSTIEHINQFTSSISQLSIFGKGIATFGVRTSVGTESAYISIVGQMGLIALLIYLYLFIYPFRKVKITRSINKSSNNCVSIKSNIFVDVMPLLLINMSAIYLITGLISEQLIAYTSICPFYILLGYSIGLIDEKNKIKYSFMMFEVNK